MYDSSTREANYYNYIYFAKYCQVIDLKIQHRTFTITYTATLNENAVLGQTGNTNKVQLKYTNKGEDEQTISPDQIKSTTSIHIRN